MEAPGPLLLAPRLDARPWGGRRLAEFGLALPPDQRIGEAVATAAEATVRSGPLAGRRLGEIVAADPVAALGRRGLRATGGRPLFPLLVKLIDAAENLSIQVHPDDAVAAREDLSLGKTEAWHVLAAPPGGVLYLGLRPGVTASDLAAALSGSPLAPLLRRVPAVAHTTVLIPAGTVHALGAGVLVYEIQQPSTITYRLDDWGRLDAAGRPRELHVAKGLAAVAAGYRPEIIAPVSLAGARRRILAACRYFAIEAIALEGGDEIALPDGTGPQAITCLSGSPSVTADDRESPMAAGATVVLLAASTGAHLRGTAPTTVVRAWLPDLAEDVVRAGAASGAGTEALARLAGPLLDVRNLLALEPTTREP